MNRENSGDGVATYWTADNKTASVIVSSQERELTLQDVYRALVRVLYEMDQKVNGKN